MATDNRRNVTRNKLKNKRSRADPPQERRPKSELATPKLPPNGFPAEFPYNKDGYRYVLAEPDPHGPFRQEFEESQDLAGKPIPGWLCRKLCPQDVALSLHDRAPQLKISEDRRLVSGDKGYCCVRANYGVCRGNWFFECKLTELPDGAAVRLGVAQELANLQAPLGYDLFGYSVRSRKGTKFHDSRGRHFAESWNTGDVIGFLLSLPSSRTTTVLPPVFKDKPLVKFKSFLYFESKDDPNTESKALKPLVGSTLDVFRNGQWLGTAFDDLNAGTYFPAASLYKSAAVSVNFGPDFAFPPSRTYRPWSDVPLDQMAEQTLAEMLFFVQNEGTLRLDTFYGN
ncbi:set1/Ash2 histone methyltransferase complex subunit ASH2-like [Oppia nitens]|uniref:set1/Ash2 histone methyltransferase complex subunit ASH2-like n=1 Tax=Oppia nitens TaxID=1686743 RepID=UPI0023DAD16D|nr:set1/Ash2 histone methyltransferase complex subunit ASH2-like [Oppia nitens]